MLIGTGIGIQYS